MGIGVHRHCFVALTAGLAINAAALAQERPTTITTANVLIVLTYHPNADALPVAIEKCAFWLDYSITDEVAKRRTRSGIKLAQAINDIAVLNTALKDVQPGWRVSVFDEPFAGPFSSVVSGCNINPAKCQPQLDDAGLDVPDVPVERQLPAWMSVMAKRCQPLVDYLRKASPPDWDVLTRREINRLKEGLPKD